jgi:hypothetical protein
LIATEAAPPYQQQIAAFLKPQAAGQERLASA